MGKPDWKDEAQKHHAEIQNTEIGIPEPVKHPLVDEDGWIEWNGGECPVPADVLMEVKFKSGGSARTWDATMLRWAHTQGRSDIVAYRSIASEQAKPIDPVAVGTISEEQLRELVPGIKTHVDGYGDYPVTAASILDRAAGHMRERAATYDKPDGERSMGKTVQAFNAITGKELTEAEGWLLLQILKDVRLFQRPGCHMDSAEDCAAYSALKAEAKAKEEK